ncbi:L-threonylcarbamoyladenylate synthase, partial [Archangium sp.]|uniref:L-threonylcarbamoyladenylate synthase n=1 Tax=Archangium sp. TaxID=1872627 RepID=UPI002ED8FBC6
MLTPDLLAQAVETLRRGGVIALPTETVYGLAANAEDELAVRRVFAIKGRPATHPLIVHVARAEELSSWARHVPEEAHRLAAAFWPGPLTLVLPRSARATDAVTGGQDTVAVRVPNHPIALAVLDALGGGVAAPSANRFGRVSPTAVEHVRADLGDEVDLLLDGGPCTVGLESTIVDLSGKEPAVLRPGGLAVEELERVLGRRVPVRTSSTVRVSGSLASHYAPRAGVVLSELMDVGSRVEVLRAQGQSVGVLGPPSL